MSLTRRQIVASAGAALAAPALARAQSGRRTVLTLTHAFAATHTAMVADLAKAFMEKFPSIELRPQLVGDNWEPLLQATLRNGLVGDLPDVSHQSLTFTRIFVRNGFAQPLDDLAGGVAGVERLGVSRAILEPIQGKLYSLPFSTTLPVIYYNRTLLKQAGFEGDRLPQTWPEIIEAARKVAALGPRLAGGYIEYSSTNGWMFQNLVASFGGRLVKEDETEVAFDGPVGLAAMRIFQEFGAASKAPDLSQNQARQSFNSGAMGLLVRSASGIPSLVAAAKDKFELGIGHFPVPHPDGRLIGAGSGLVMFTKDPEKQRAAWDYIRFAIGPEGQAILPEKTGYMPINRIAVQDPRYLGAYYAANPHHRTLVERLAITSDWYSFPNNTVKIFDGWIEETRKVILQQQSPEQGLAAMAELTRRLMRTA